MRRGLHRIIARVEVEKIEFSQFEERFETQAQKEKKRLLKVRKMMRKSKHKRMWWEEERK